MTHITVSKPGLVIVSIIIVLFLTFWYFKVHAAQVFYSCTQAKAAGYHDIKRGSPLYRLDLDRDKDGIACEL